MNLQKFVPIIKTAIIIGVFALLYTPFIVSNSMYFPYITGKAFFFRIVTEIIFGLWIVLALINRENRPRCSAISRSFVIFTVIILLADWFGDNRLASFGSNFERMEGFLTIAHLLGLFFVVSNTFTKKIWLWFFNASTLASVIAIFQAFSQIAEKGFNYRIDTTLGNPIYLAVYMLFSAFISLWLISQIKKDGIREHLRDFRFWIYSVVFLLQSVILFQTGTRGAMLGLLGGLLLSAVLVVIFAKGQPILRKSFAGLLLAVIVFVGSVFIFRDSDFIKNTSSLHRITTISANEGTGQARLWNWGIAWQGIKEKPLLGWGQSNFNLVYDKHYDPKMYEQEPWFDRTHSIIFDWLIAGGFLGLLSYLAILVSTLYVLWRSRNFTIVEKSILTGLGAGYFIHNLFVFDNMISYIYFIFLISFIASNSSKEIKSSGKDISEDLKNILAVAVLIATCVTVYVVNHAPYSASQRLIDAIQIFKRENEKIFYNYDQGLSENINIYKEIIGLNSFGNPEIRARLVSGASEVLSIKNIPQEDKNAFVSYAVTEMEKQISEAPTDARYPYLLSSLFAQMGDLGKAIENIDRAIELSPQRQIFYFFKAQLLLGAGDKKGAIEIAKKAYELSPQLDRAWSNFASILSAADKNEFDKLVAETIAEGKFSRVENMIKSGMERNPQNYQNYVSLSALYFQMGNSDEAIKTLNDAREKFPNIKSSIDQLIKQISSGQNPVGKGF